MNLAFVFPQPVAVEAPTGSGFLWQVLPFRLRDLAYLDAVLERLAGHPLEGRRAELRRLRADAGGDYWGSSPVSRAYAAALRAFEILFHDPWAWPPDLLSEAGAELLAGPEGRIEWLVTLLGRTHPDDWDRTRLSARAVETILHLDPEADLALNAAAWAKHPFEEISRLMDPAPPIDLDWGEEIYRLIEATGWDFDRVGDLYVTQWLVMKNRGKWEPGALRGHASWQDAVGERRLDWLTHPGNNGHA